jgi:hypothetical protein
VANSTKKYKTLFYQHGSFRIEGEDKKTRNVPTLPAVYVSFEEALRNRYASSKVGKKPKFVLYEDFKELLEEVNAIENKLRSLESGQLENAVKEALECLNEVNGIVEIKNLSENKNLTLVVLAKKLSADLFRKVAEVEIRLAKKFTDLHIDIQPAMTEKD